MILPDTGEGRNEEMMNIYTKSNSLTTPSYLHGPSIPDGSRNVILTSIAGSLHDGTRSLEELVRDLHAINKARCKPPLSKHEIEKIAKSIHKRPMCVPSKGKPPPEVLNFVHRHWLGVLAVGTWKGQGGGSEYKVYEALLDVAQHHGWLSEFGNVVVSVSVRDLAMRAGVATKTCHAALKRLQRKRLLYRIPSETIGTAGRLVLREVAPQDAKHKTRNIHAH
jgi:Primase C terminal 1 (PriCT-1)